MQICIFYNTTNTKQKYNNMWEIENVEFLTLKLPDQDADRTFEFPVASLGSRFSPQNACFAQTFFFPNFKHIIN